MFAFHPFHILSVKIEKKWSKKCTLPLSAAFEDVQQKKRHTHTLCLKNKTRDLCKTMIGNSLRVGKTLICVYLRFERYLGMPSLCRTMIGNSVSVAKKPISVYLRWERYLVILFAEQLATVWRLSKPSWRLCAVSLSMMRKQLHSFGYLQGSR